MSRIFVGNCSFNVTEDELRSVFAAYGEVSSVSVITDRDTGRPRGFAFVEMSDDTANRVECAPHRHARCDRDRHRLRCERLSGRAVRGQHARAPGAKLQSGHDPSRWRQRCEQIARVAPLNFDARRCNSVEAHASRVH